MHKTSGGTDVRKFTYTITSNRIDKIDIEEKIGSSWYLYRKIDFTYHENVTSPVESTTGDLVGIKEELLLTPSNTWSERKWVFKYYTATGGGYSGTNPGYPYQVKAVLGPQSVHDWETTHSGQVIYTKYTDPDLLDYVDRVYKYEADKRLDELNLKESCGCGGGEGIYAYAWAVNPYTPSDMNTWYHCVTITLPDPDGGGSQHSPVRTIDYNKYGQKLNSIVQEDSTDSNSRKWLATWRHDTTGRLTDSCSPKRCTGYSSHVVGISTATSSTERGEHWKFSYGTNSELVNVKLFNPNDGQDKWQTKKTFDFLTSGDRRRFVKRTETIYPTETSSDTGGITTSWSYSYHTSSDALAIRKRETSMPVISGSENGSGHTSTPVKRFNYFELDGLLTWSEDGSEDGTGFVHYSGWDANRRTVTKTVRNIHTTNRPSGVPAPPSGEGFDSSPTIGFNIVSDTEYDYLRRPKQAEGPAFNAWTGSTVASVRTTMRWYYTKLSGGETVVAEYPHVTDTEYYHAPIALTMNNFDGHVLVSAQGSLYKASRTDPGFSDDFSSTPQSTLQDLFQGILIQRTDYSYVGDKLISEVVWSDALSTSADRYTTTHAYDSTGRKEKTTNAAGTITKWSYDALGRAKTTKIGTVDGGGSDNMTLVEERFYDDEEDSPGNVGDGNLTKLKRYTSYQGGSRDTTMAYDYRLRLTEMVEPGSVSETRTYTNQNQPKLIQRYDVSTASLMAKTESFYDAWGQVYEGRTYGVVNGDDNGYYVSVKTWRNPRGLVVKVLSQGKVFQKTQYDGAGRVLNQAVSYDTTETSYAAAMDLSNDTVVQETRYALDGTGAAELTAVYERRHVGDVTGGLTVGSSGNSRAQYIAAWFDKLHRPSHSVTYGTNGGTNLDLRPTGNPPSTGDGTSQLVTTFDYETKGENEGEDETMWLWRLEIVTDPMGIKAAKEYDDTGHVLRQIDNYVQDGTGATENRTIEYTYNAAGQNSKITANASSADQVTQYDFGVVRGTSTGNSLITSNDLLKQINYPNPGTGLPSTSSVDQEFFAYNAQGETVWRKDQAGTEHTYTLDARGRLTLDDVTTLAAGIDGTVRKISRTYDALDRSVLVTSKDASGGALNEVEFEYDRYGVVSKIWQEWTGAVTGSSKRVEFAYSFPTNGTTSLRRTSTTYPGSTVITEVYNSGTDDILSRPSGRKKGTSWLFDEKYLGVGRLVERQYGSTGVYWTLVGTDQGNNDNYVGLDRFGRIDDLIVRNSTENINRYVYSYNERSQTKLRQDEVGHVGTSYDFDESAGYDGLGRLANHQRGLYTGSGMYPLRLQECWTLDRSGNCTDYYSGTASTCGSTWTASFNHSNECTGWSELSTAPEYNNPGDFTEKGSQAFAYDAWNRLVSVKDTVLQVWLSGFTYNGLNQKIKRFNATLPDLYYYYNDQWQVVDEIKVSDSSQYNWYAWGTQYIDDLVVRGPATEYQVQDSQYNVVTRLNYDGTVYRRYIYDAYGMPKQLMPGWTEYYQLSEDLHLFTGRFYHKDIGQYDYRMRMYDPELQRFDGRDPAENPNDFGNAYVYVSNDPLNDSDAIGLRPGKGRGLWKVAEINALMRRSLSAGFPHMSRNGRLIPLIPFNGAQAYATGAGPEGDVLADKNDPIGPGPKPGTSSRHWNEITVPVTIFTFPGLRFAGSGLWSQIIAAKSIIGRCRIKLQINVDRVLETDPIFAMGLIGRDGAVDRVDEADIAAWPRNYSELRVYYVPQKDPVFGSRKAWSYPQHAFGGTVYANSTFMVAGENPSVRVLAHEIFHHFYAFGHHDSNGAMLGGDNLMYPRDPPGNSLTQEQCQAARDMITAMGLTR
jgi:RHS repeat-associated protein